MSGIFDKFINKVLMERDIYNTNDIKNIVNNYLEYINTNNAKKWFQSQLFKYLINDYNSYGSISKIKANDIPSNAPEWVKTKIKNGGEVYFIHNISREMTNSIQMVIDYINHITNQNENSQINLTFKEAINQTYKWHEELKNQKKQEEDENKERLGSILIKRYSNGYKWVKLLSEYCLSREGNLMGHCVADYSPQVSKNLVNIFSLRDEKNNPHVTMEIRKNAVVQVSAKANLAPAKKYIPYIRDIIKVLELKIQDDHQMIGYIKLNGITMDINEIPEGTKINNTLELDSVWLSKLPDKLTVRNLDIEECPNFTQLPNRLIVNNLNMYNCNITTLPSDIIVTDSLNIIDSKFQSFPENLKHYDCEIRILSSDLIYIPNGVTIKNMLTINNCPIRQLPDNLTVYKDLTLIKLIHLTELPNNLYVKKDLVLGYSNITKLPDSLEVKGTIHVAREMEYIPKHLRKRIKEYKSNQ